MTPGRHFGRNLTICIFAFNEESRLQDCLDNFKDFRNVVVIDNCSTDLTPDIAIENGIKLLRRKNLGFIENEDVIEFLYDHVETDYVLIAFAGEYLPRFLLNQYRKVSEEGSYDVVLARRISVTAGLLIPLDGNAAPNSYQIRFFRKRSVDFKGNKIHGLGRIACHESRVLNVSSRQSLAFFQFRDYDASETEHKHRNYNDVWALQRYEDGERFSWLRALKQTLISFIYSYIKLYGWKYGFLGFMHAYYRAHMVLTVWFRVWEHQHGYNKEGVTKHNRLYRRALQQRDSTTDERES